MSTPLEQAIALVSAEDRHMSALNDCFIYFAALAETRHRRAVSDLFECLPAGYPTRCDDSTALQIHEAIIQFIEKNPHHPNVGSAFRNLLHLNASKNLRSYFLDKLRFLYAQGHAHAVFQLCIVLEDMGMDVFRDEAGHFIQSRSSCEAETNMGVARRFLERQNAEPGAAPNAAPRLR